MCLRGSDLKGTAMSARAQAKDKPAPVSFKWDDAFLLDEPDFHRTLAGFLAGCAEHAGLAA